MSILALLGFNVGCGGGVSPRDSNRSMKQYELAVGLHQEGSTPDAYKTLFKAIEIDPNNPKAHLLLGHLFLVAREDNPSYDEKAEIQLRKTIEIQSGEHKHPEDLAADAYNALGVLYIHQGKYVEAEKELMTAVDDIFNRDAFMAWGNLGWLYHEQGKLKDAVKALKRALKLQPRFCVGHLRLGKVHMAAKSYDKADAAFTQAIEADDRCDTFQDAYHLRGEVRMNLGSREDARADFERCVELSKASKAGEACQRYLEATY